MIKLVRRSTWVLVIGLLAVFTGCGQISHKAAESSFPVVRYALNTSSTLAALPLQVALKLHLFQNERIQPKISARAKANLVVSESNPSWPLIGYLGSRPDLLIISPGPDPHFRLRVLNHLPVVYAANLRPYLGLIHGVMNLNRTDPSFHSAPFRHLETLWKEHRLPWAMVSLSQYFALRQKDPHSVILNWLGASTGPIPVITISGHSTHSVQFLRALNLALWYIHTSSPEQIAHVVGDNPRDLVLTQAIQKAMHFDLWPETTLISPQEYNRGRALYGLGTRDIWPPYFAGVNAKLSRQALTAAY